MKVKLEVDCTPAEARAFLGLPNVEALNDHLVEEMRRRMDANMAALRPEELWKTWSALGGQATEQFRTLMNTAAAAGMSGAARKPGD